jgi:hypothetical protein
MTPKELPILFSAPMVQAILEGRKEQTRRIVKPQPDRGFAHMEYHRDGTCEVGINIDSPNHYQIHCPYGGCSDRLWVRETFQEIPDDGGTYVYRATDPDWEDSTDWKWKPSIFMPRKASRITLEIVSVRVERLQEISGADCISEGTEYFVQEGTTMDAKLAYRLLWESINGKGSWARNPWVWVICFKRVEK